MDISCDIIHDLLPLYAEDLVSNDSRKLVDEHLCGCDDCIKVLGNLKKETRIPVESDPQTLKKVKKTIRRRRILSVMAAVLTLITLASFVMTYLFAPFQLTKEQALDNFYVREDGAVVIDFSSAVVGRVLSGWDENWFINQYSTRYDMWKGENRKSIEELYGTDGVITEEEQQRYESIEILTGRWATPDGSVSSDADIPWREDERVVEWESEKNWWYADPTGRGNDILLHDAGKEYPEYREQFSPVYPLIFFGGIASALLLVLLGRILKNVWMKELACRLCILCASGAISTLFVSSGRIFTTTVGIIDHYWGPMITANTVLLTLAILFWHQLYRMNKQDRGL